MLNQSVLIKSNQYGLTVVLDKELDWETLKNDVAEKFKSSAKFFGEAQMVLRFQGRELSLEEERELSDTIASNCQIRIVCIEEENEMEEQVMKRILERRQDGDEDSENFQDGRFYKGTLRSGQVLESETSIIILGDVNPGARVISRGNVVVLGTLKGTVCVGASGNESAFVAALSMEPMQIQIGNVIARSSDSPPVRGGRKKKTAETPKIAFVEEGSICIGPITKEILNVINL